MGKIIGNHQYNKNTSYEVFKTTPFFKTHGDKPCFYVIQPQPCGNKSQSTLGYKLGKTEGQRTANSSGGTSMKDRFRQYEVHYNKFYILHVRVFDKATRGTHFTGENENPITLAKQYEKFVINELKSLKVLPVRGNEFFEKYTDIKKAIGNVDKRFAVSTVPVVNNRVNVRIRKPPQEWFVVK